MRLAVFKDGTAENANHVQQAIVCLFSLAIYNIYFHPLARFPGPKTAAMFNVCLSNFRIPIIKRGSLLYQEAVVARDPKRMVQPGVEAELTKLPFLK